MAETSEITIKVVNSDGSITQLQKSAYFVGQIFAVTDAVLATGEKGYSVTHLSSGMALISLQSLNAAITVVVGTETLFNVEQLESDLNESVVNGSGKPTGTAAEAVAYINELRRGIK